jgi:S1-C subfamily serine protease
LQEQASFLIDANIFPGNSGGPVVTRPEISSIEGTKAIDKAALIGIVKSYLTYKDVAVSQQTGKPRVIFEENSGLALVETVDRGGLVY